MTSKYVIEKTADNRQAWLTIFDYQNLSKEELYDAMSTQQIACGIIPGAIDDLLKRKIVGEKKLVALFTPPVRAQDDRMELLVDVEIKPALTINDKVDYYDLHFIKDVEAGRHLFNFYEGTNGQDGQLLDGTPIPVFPKRKTINIIKMTDANCRLIKRENGLVEGYAKINGSLLVSQGKLAVTNNIIINSELNFRTGNLVSSYSSLHIRGGIKNNFKASSPQNIVVEANVENSEITARNLSVKMGILKGSRPILIDNHLQAGFIANRTNIYAGLLTVTQELRNSSIGVRDKAIIFTLTGGTIFVGNTLEVETIGGQALHNTTIVMGIDKLKQDMLQGTAHQLQRQRVKLTQMRKEKVKIKNKLDEFRFLKQKEGFIAKYDARIKHLEEEFVFFEEDLKKEETRELELLKKYNLQASQNKFNHQAFIIVKHKLFPGTVIKFGQELSIRTRKEYGPCTIQLGEEINIVIEHDRQEIQSVAQIDRENKKQ